MRKLMALFTIIATFGIASLAQAFPLEKKTLLLEDDVFVGARMYCLHEAENSNVSYASRLRYGELAEMIGAHQVTYAKSYNPRNLLHASEVWHLYLKALELEAKLEKEDTTRKNQIKEVWWGLKRAK